jgi:hypothetical protein
VNELPISHRFKMENIILLGLWFGNKKPNMNSFLSPVVQMINEANSFGINVNNPNIPLVFALLLPVICDSKGRNEVMNFVAANGFFGCSKCLHPGQHMDGRHIYSHNSDAKASQNELRTDENLQLCLQDLIA